LKPLFGFCGASEGWPRGDKGLAVVPLVCAASGAEVAEKGWLNQLCGNLSRRLNQLLENSRNWLD
jgi:hypothetical protein